MLHSLHNSILHLDHSAWYYINVVWHNAVLDAVLIQVRNPWFWSPLYLFLLCAMPYKYKRVGWWWCLGFFISFVISDQLSATLLKPFFHRLRPCFNPALTGIVHSLVPCGGLYGFPSSHAANHFSIGIFSAVTLGSRYKWVWPAAIVWALLVSYAQVYVGVHYPLDVVCGGIIGILIGILTGKLYNRFFLLLYSTS